MFDVLHYAFIQNALLTGSFVAIVAALVGYFLVLRGLTFAGHALPNIGFAGAAGAVLLGTSPVAGLLAFTIVAAIAIGLLGERLRERDIAIGILMTLALGLGILFLSLYHGYAEQAYSILFGTILGISQSDVEVTAACSLGTLLALLVLFRPLLFSSYDPEVAQTRGVPVVLLRVIFLVLTAITISMAVQVVGALLIFTLLIGPVATAMQLVRHPLSTILLASALGVTYTCLGILLAGNSTWPVSFYIASIAFLVYLPVRLLAPSLRRGSRRGTRERRTNRAEQPLAVDTQTQEPISIAGGEQHG